MSNAIPKSIVKLGKILVVTYFSIFDFFKYWFNKMGFTTKFIAIKGIIKLVKRSLNSYSDEIERINATATPPLNPPRVRTFCH